jgi:hypothetical protein
MNGLDIVKKLRAQLDKNGYKDVEMKLIGDVPWSRGSSPDTDISAAWKKSEEHMQAIGLMRGPEAPLPGPAPRTSAANRSNDLFVHESGSDMGGYWPSYLWTDGEVGEKVGTIKIPMGMGGPGGAGGGRAHAANEFFIVEAKGKQGGLAYQEKGVAAAIFEYSRITTTPPKPKTSTAK